MKHTETPETAARTIVANGLISGTLSSPIKRDTDEAFDRIRIRKVALSGKTLFQLEQLRGPQAFHRNVEEKELEAFLAVALAVSFARAECITERGTISVLSNRRGELTVIQKEKTNTAQATGHDRSKRRILEEGTPIPFLIDLGVMTADGAVINQKRDKFRQVNRFLEFIEDVLPELRRASGKEGRELTVVDFGCGKSYLTFAVYHYLSVIARLPVRIIGLDLKRDVIESCAALASSYGYEKLEFAVGDIAGYRGTDRADMVITLHACDTATDFALAQAVKWGASVILSVPCCQHELNAALGDASSGGEARDTLKAAFRHGIVRERLAALFTDAMRAELLEGAGYRTQILEFIDMSHTPKNLLIRAIRANRPTAEEGGTDAYHALKGFLGTAPTLEAELAKKKEPL